MKKAQREKSQRKNNHVPLNKKIEGVVKRHPDGYGFFIPDEMSLPDVYIPKQAMDGIMSSDRVEVLVRRDGDRYRGDITRVVQRETKQISGRLKVKTPSTGLLMDESFAWGEDLKASWAPNIKVKDGDWVVVKVTSYPDSVRGFHGTVEAVIGDISDPLNDNIRVLSASSIPHQFSAKALEQARALPHAVDEKDFAGRVDLRKKALITIDGKTAKDFDDAIYVEKSGKGFRLWVAIADVSHYVRPGSAIDKDAYERGTSTYFPNFVAPMLPEELSNELCSLKPNVPRLALVAEMEFNFQGDMVSSKFYEAVIQSHARVTYGEAQEVLDGRIAERLLPLKGEIQLAGQLAQILMDKRFREGSLNLDLPESVIELSDAGIPTDIIKSDRLFAHRLIEELMLAANVAVARFFKQKSMAAIYRIHESPKEEALETLERFLLAFGYTRKLGSGHLQKRITQALQEFNGAPQEPVINMLALRSMKQAKYSPQNVGHFGLGFSDYTHFTSPIRRYPDLIVHRLLKAGLHIKGYAKMGMDDLESAGSMTSACEQRSVKAERLIHSIKKARFMQKFLGREFEGIITAVTKFGVFVSLRQYDVDGLIRLEELGGDRYEFDEENLRLVGRQSGRAYSIGDKMTVQVAATDYQAGRVDFVLPKEEVKGHAVKAKNKPDQERRTPQDNRSGIRQIRVSGHHRKGQPSSPYGSRKTSPRKHK